MLRTWQRWNLEQALLFLELSLRDIIICSPECLVGEEGGCPLITCSCRNDCCRIDCTRRSAWLKALPWADACLSFQAAHMGALAHSWICISGWQNRYPDVDSTLVIGTHGTSSPLAFQLRVPTQQRMTLGPAGFPRTKIPISAHSGCSASSRIEMPPPCCGVLHSVPALCQAIYRMS